MPTSEAGRRAQEWLTLELFREGAISTGKAAQILGITKTQFILPLTQRGIDHLDSRNWTSVCYYFDTWTEDGTWQAINDALREQARQHIGVT